MEEMAQDVRYCLVNGQAKALGARLANAAVPLVVVHADTSEPITRLAPLLFEVRRALEPDGVALVFCARPDLLPLAALGTRSGFDAEPPCLWHTPDGPRWLLPLRRQGGAGPLLPLIACDEDEDATHAWATILRTILRGDGAPDAPDEDTGAWLVELDARDGAFALAAFALGASWLGNGRAPTRGEAAEGVALGEQLEASGVRAASAVSGVLQETMLMARPSGLPQLFPMPEPTAATGAPKRPRRRGPVPPKAMPMFDATGTD